MLDKKIFTKGMAALMAAFPDYQCSEKTIEIYYQRLKDFHPQDFERVITAHIDQQKWFPKICELKEELVRLKGFNRPTATDIWEKMIKAAEQDQRPEMDENTERALRVCGGWTGFCTMTYRDLQFHRKDFERVYNEGLEREDRQLKIGHQGPEQRLIANEGN